MLLLPSTSHLSVSVDQEEVDWEAICNDWEGFHQYLIYFNDMVSESKPDARIPTLLGPLGRVINLWTSLIKKPWIMMQLWRVGLCGTDGERSTEKDPNAKEIILLLDEMGTKYTQKRKEWMAKDDVCACIVGNEEMSTFEPYFYEYCEVSPLCNAPGVKVLDTGENAKYSRQNNRYVFSNFIALPEYHPIIAKLFSLLLDGKLADSTIRWFRDIKDIDKEIDRESKDFGINFFTIIDFDSQKIGTEPDTVFTLLLEIIESYKHKDWGFLAQPRAQHMAEILYSNLEIEKIQHIWINYIHNWSKLGKLKTFPTLVHQASAILNKEVWVNTPIDILFAKMFQIAIHILTMIQENTLDGGSWWNARQSGGSDFYIGSIFSSILQNALEIWVQTDPLHLPLQDTCFAAKFVALFPFSTNQKELIEFYSGVQENLNAMDTWSLDEMCEYLPMTSKTSLALDNKFRNMLIGKFKESFTVQQNEAVEIGYLQRNKATQNIALPSSYSFFEGKYRACVREPADQSKGCAACWAFAAVGAFSHRYCKALVDNNKPIWYPGKRDGRLSVQAAISCTTTQNNGCNGGKPGLVYSWLESNYLPLTSCAPYTSYSGDEHDEKCAEILQRCPGGIKGHLDAYDFGESEMKKEIFVNGPVAAVLFLPSTFITHKEGVYNPPADVVMLVEGDAHSAHVVQIVGWGTSPEGVDYWIVENSWGAIYEPFDDIHVGGGFFLLVRNHPKMNLEKNPFFFATPVFP